LIAFLVSTNRFEDILNVVHIHGHTGSTPQVKRTTGIISEIDRHVNIHLLESVDGNWNQHDGYDAMEYLLLKYPSIDAVIVDGDMAAVGAAQAIKSVGLSPGEDILVVSIDTWQEGLNAIVLGEINASVECSVEFGSKVFEVINNIEAGKTVDKVIFISEGHIFDITNAEDALMHWTR